MNDSFRSPMNMFKPTPATSVKEYMKALPSERRELIAFLDSVIRETVPALRPYFANNMLGYGSFPSTNYKKESIEWPVIAVASQKRYVSMYVCAVENGKYVAEEYKEELGNVSVGKSCIRFTKAADLNLNALKKVLKAAERNPGLAGAGARKKK